MKIFTIIGVILLVIGLFFAYQAMQPAVTTGPFDIDVMHEAAPSVALTLVPLGLIFTLVGWYMTRAMGQRDELIEHGLPGMATISSAAETGVFVNERPMIKLTMTVQVPGQPPYAVEHREVVPLVALGMITPGSTLPVVVKPTDPQKLAIDWSGESQTRLLYQASGGTTVGMGASAMGTPATVAAPNTLTSMGSSFGAPNTLSATPTPAAAPDGWVAAGETDAGSGYQTPGRAGITASGGAPIPVGSMMMSDAGHVDVYEQQVAGMRPMADPGRATIVTAQDMGVAVQSDKLIQFMLNVTPETGASYVVQHVGIVPPGAMVRAMPGARVAVLIDRNNPQNVVIDWDRT